MKPSLEKIEPVFGSSFTIRKFTERNVVRAPFWHFHPEFEIVYISNGSGKRHIGNHISYYQEGDLIFLGPKLPHLSFTDDLQEVHTEVVLQMKADFLGAEFWAAPEMVHIRQLFERARQGLSFRKPIKEKIGHRLVEMYDMDNFSRLLALIELLQELALSEDYDMLNASGFGVEVNPQEEQRINAIYSFVDANYHRAIRLEEIAAEVSMTVPAFCRYFKKLTQKTFTQFVNEYRIAYACKLLSRDHLGISEVCFESGFNNFSHFNKQFRAITGKSPSAYRKELGSLVKTPHQ
ncbi:MAG: AraC family transcriptional regulator [Bacteroidota bacterium]